MPFVAPVTLQAHGVRLVPLAPSHAPGLRAAAADGELWKLVVTSVPDPEQTAAWVATALLPQEQSGRFAFAVTLAETGQVIGSTSYHDIVPAIRRVEIGHTWYARRFQRTHVNTTAKLLLLTHAFETLHCTVVGWRTDGENFASQAAIERLGAKKDGVIRRHRLRRDGHVADTVLYSMLAEEWGETKARLEGWLGR
ncbi:MAG: GNAT family N-acetyltransferase [Alphaproteobacteria bacterium]|nr:GNAT family N-acetyltransferase [Alphaproteobacteria bacterium]